MTLNRLSPEEVQAVDNGPIISVPLLNVRTVSLQHGTLCIVKYLLAAQKNVVTLFIRPSFECLEDFVLPYTSVSSGSVHESTWENGQQYFFSGSVWTICCAVKGTIS